MKMLLRQKLKFDDSSIFMIFCLIIKPIMATHIENGKNFTPSVFERAVQYSSQDAYLDVPVFDTDVFEMVMCLMPTTSRSLTIRHYSIALSYIYTVYYLHGGKDHDLIENFLTKCQDDKHFGDIVNVQSLDMEVLFSMLPLINYIDDIHKERIDSKIYKMKVQSRSKASSRWSDHSLRARFLLRSDSKIKECMELKIYSYLHPAH